MANSPLPLSLVMITKNEAHCLERAILSVPFAAEVVVVDSGSTDETVALARRLGARVVQTVTWPGFGEQKNRALLEAAQPWVLSLDADEWLSEPLQEEMRRLVSTNPNAKLFRQMDPVGFYLPRLSRFLGQEMHWGDWRHDRVLRLVHRKRARFSMDAVHEKLLVDGPTERFEGVLHHDSMPSIQEARAKLDRYARLGAQRLRQNGRGGALPAVLHGLAALARGLLIRGGFLDGMKGVRLAWLNSRATFLKYWWASDWAKRLGDHLNLFLVDHGFLRAIYSNRFRLAGGLYRCSQPSPRQLAAYKARLGIRSVINLRDENHYQGWYRLEEAACSELGLRLHNVKLYSRGLLNASDLEALRLVIEKVELPAIVHCKSGADRAGFFSALFRHYRNGEPIEMGVGELSMKYGHFKQAKTGVLDHFFLTFRRARRARQSFRHWVMTDFNPQQVEASFRPATLSSLVVDRVLRRE